MNENAEGRNDWMLLAGVGVGAVVALLVGPSLIGGVAIGLGLGLLFSPKAGRETRRGIGDWVKSLRSKTQRKEAPAASTANAGREEPPAKPKPSSAPPRDLHKISS